MMKAAGKSLVNALDVVKIFMREGKTIIVKAGKECGFTIWKEDKFFLSKRKPLTKPMVKRFLEKGRIKAV